MYWYLSWESLTLRVYLIHKTVVTYSVISFSTYFYHRNPIVNIIINVFLEGEAELTNFLELYNYIYFLKLLNETQIIWLTRNYCDA